MLQVDGRTAGSQCQNHWWAIHLLQGHRWWVTWRRGEIGAVDVEVDGLEGGGEVKGEKRRRLVVVVEGEEEEESSELRWRRRREGETS